MFSGIQKRQLLIDLFSVVISGVLMKLNWYDSTLSDRYKLIEYRDSDNMAKVVEPINYFTNVSIPVFIGNVILI